MQCNKHRHARAEAQRSFQVLVCCLDSDGKLTIDTMLRIPGKIAY